MTDTNTAFRPVVLVGTSYDDAQWEVYDGEPTFYDYQACEDWVYINEQMGDMVRIQERDFDAPASRWEFCD